MSETHYKHTQSGTAMLACLAAVAVLVLLVTPWQLAAIPLMVLITVAVLFFSLTIQITDTHLCWHFGPGFWKKSLPLNEITDAEMVKNRWYYGLGIRLIPSGWLYAVSGLSAVRVTLENGKVITLGSDEAETLKNALTRRLTS